MKVWMVLLEDEWCMCECDGIVVWYVWVECYCDVIVELGGLFGKIKIIDVGGICDMFNVLSGFSVVWVVLYEVVVVLFEGYLYFMLFLGVLVDVMLVLVILGV